MKYGVSSLLFTLVFGSTVAEAQIFAPPNFVIDNLHFGDGTVALDFAPDGRIYVTEKQGRVLTLAPDGAGGYRSATEFYNLIGQVNSNQESGLLGLAVDPNYAVNRYVYLFFTTSFDQRLARVTANSTGNAVVPGSYTVILSGLSRQYDIHNAGNIRFRPGEPNAIYISTGDDSNPGAVQNLNAYNGKMLKVDKSTGRGLSTNPYWDGNSNSTRSRLWSIGFRNPFRFTFHPDRSSIR